MREKRVIRYYCDFCGKGMCRRPDMARHESVCTLNPNRTCRLCEAGGEISRPVSELRGCLPKEADFKDSRGRLDDDAFYAAVNASIDDLRDAANQCPACMLAALRQHGVCDMAHGFRYREEVKAYWDEVNAHLDEERHAQELDSL